MDRVYSTGETLVDPPEHAAFCFIVVIDTNRRKELYTAKQIRDFIQYVAKANNFHLFF